MKTTIAKTQIKLWIYDAQAAVGRLIQAGDAAGAAAMLRFIECNLLSNLEQDKGETVSEGEEVPF